MKQILIAFQLASVLLARLALLPVATLSAAAETTEADPGSSVATTVRYSPHADEAIPRGLYWGDTHVHSSWSVDAGNTGNLRIGPDDAYRFARGEAVRAHNGMTARLDRPLDFLVLSDHAEYLGVMPRLDAGDPLARATEVGERWYGYRKRGESPQLFREFADSILSGQDVIGNAPLQQEVWRDVVSNAERHNRPGVFTAFIGYEWTSSAGGNNLHRNVIFRDGAERARRTIPFSSLDSVDPEDLWAALARYEARTGGRVLAIPHNANLSGGQMFAVETMGGAAFTPAYARARARFEPLLEVTQIKGDSETHPFLSPDDEFADYETWNVNIAGKPNEPGSEIHSYARSALELGLGIQAELGINPFKLGLIGSSDAHTGLAAVEEDNYWGKFTLAEPAAGRWKVPFWPEGTSMGVQHFEWQMAASGYAAVWATENTREALFDAMVRRETYATTGPRIVVRFFGGWGYEPTDAAAPDVARVGYAGGVPMGGDLPARPDEAAGAPRFLLSVLKDPEGANLDRVQLIKGWRDAQGELHERVYDVAVSGGRRIGPDGRARARVGSSVDVARARYSNSIGAASFSTLWQDPDFDPEEHAFYYVRVIEIPKPRWTAYDARFFGTRMDEAVPMVTQDRAYTSPIWYTPNDRPSR